MNRTAGSIAMSILPPVISAAIRRARAPYRFTGSYASWQEALAASRGYDDPAVVERVRRSALSVLRGDAAFERDGVAFKTSETVWPVLAGLLWAASQHRAGLHVLDIGGSLGSLYFQHRKYFEHLRNLRWTVVEQPAIVSVGRKEFESRVLKFEDDLRRAVKGRRPQVLILSSMLQYLPDPYDKLREFLDLKIPRLIIDRTAVVAGPDVLTVQEVYPPLYRASYPAWFLSERRLRATIGDAYDVVTEFPSMESATVSGVRGARDLGLICIRRGR